MRKIKFEYRITIIYLFFGLVWILLSDYLVDFLDLENEFMINFQSLKGSFFVLITAVLLFFISRRHAVQQARASEQLEESNAKYKALYYENKAIILLTDSIVGEIVDANKAALHFYGYTLEEITKLRIDDINILLVKEKQFEKQKAKKEGRNFHLYKHRLASGEVRHVQEYSGFIRNSDKSLQYLLIHDVTQQIEAENQLIEAKEKAEESDRLKSAFLANMSHEIRTPMNGIMGFVRLLESVEPGKEKYATYLHYVRKSSERLLGTINDIIEISKIESNQAVLNETEFDVNESVQYLFGFFKPQMAEKGLDFRLENSLPGETVVFRTDKIKFESVLTNFLKNSLKFTREGYVELGCIKEQKSWVFYVKDTGMGIPREKQKYIFERFRQADIALTRPYEGSGLGLAIARAYAQMIGGEIGMDSEEGSGSIFYLKLSNPGIVVQQSTTVSSFLKTLSST